MARNEGESKALHGVEALQYSIDFVTAIMLLTGRITTSGIFVVPEGFFWLPPDLFLVETTWRERPCKRLWD